MNLIKASLPNHTESIPAWLFPSTYRTNQGDLSFVKSNERDFLVSELSVDGLNSIYQHLWLAGLPMPPRPLHYQMVLQREVIICERMDMHLVWGNGRIFLKPIPRFLLSSAFWNTYLRCKEGCKCTQNQSKSSVAGIM